MLEISRILDLVLVAYFEQLYFSISVALISTAPKFIKESDDCSGSFGKQNLQG